MIQTFTDRTGCQIRQECDCNVVCDHDVYIVIGNFFGSDRVSFYKTHTAEGVLPKWIMMQ